MFGLLTGLFSGVGGAVAGTTPKFWAILILIFALLGTFGYGYYRYTSLLTTTHTQEMDIAKLKDDAEIAQKAIQDAQIKFDKTVAKYEEIRGIADGLNTKNREYQKELDRLNGVLNKQGRDIGAIAHEKPKLIQNIVNRAAKDRKRCLEVISGQPKLIGEKNEVCPNLFID